jgi:hypothetical protein
MEIHLDNAYVTLGWDNELGAVVFNWKDAAPSEAYRAAMNLTLTLFERHHSGLIFCDSTNQGEVSLADREWTTEEWSPLAIKIGLKKTAILVPVKVEAKLAIDKMKAVVEVRPNADQAAYFTDVEQAKAWLLS